MKRFAAVFVTYFLLVSTFLLIVPPQARAASAPQVDNFVAANGTNLTTYSANWTVTAGAAIIQNNAVTWNSATLGVAFRNDVAWPNDQQVTMRLTAVGTGGASQLGPAVRCTAGNNGYVVRASTTTIVVSRDAAGVLTDIFDIGANGGGQGGVPSTAMGSNLIGDILTLQIKGTTLSLFKNGALLGTGIDATFATGSAGIYGVGNAQTTAGTAWIGDAAPTATRTSTNITGTSSFIPVATWTNAGTLTQIGDVVQFTLAGNSYAYGGQIGGQVEVLATGGPIINGTFSLQWSGDGGTTWTSVAGVSNSLSGTTVAQANAQYSVVFGLSGLKAATFQIGVTGAQTIGSTLTIWICNC